LTTQSHRFASIFFALHHAWGVDVVNVGSLVEVPLKVVGVAGAEVEAAVAHQKGVQPLVGRAVAGPEGQQPARGEVRVSDCGRFGAGVHPGQDLGQVLGETGFDGPAVKLAAQDWPMKENFHVPLVFPSGPPTQVQLPAVFHSMEGGDMQMVPLSLLPSVVRMKM
jgi:hypothetical protein